MMSEEMDLRLPELPQEVIVEILSRLPCKILVKFRCVSKQWNSLIRGRSFTELHLKRSASDTSRLRVLLRPKPFYSIQCDDLDEFVQYGFDVVVKDVIPPALADESMSSSGARLVGVCNGLICFLLRKNEENSKESFLLWNPSIRESQEVDKSVAFKNVGASKILFDASGFGFDSSTNDYKIVRLVVYDGVNEVVNVEIFRIGNRTSRRLELPVFGLRNAVQMQRFWLSENGSFLNGSCYWFMRKFPSDNVILSVDLKKEEVGEVALISNISKSNCLWGASVCGGKLALVKWDIVNEYEMEIWMMDEYGVGLSFTKKVTLSQIPGLRFRCYARPICCSRNGGVLVYDGRRLAVYDPEKKTCKVARGTSWGWQYLTVYTETLISPIHISNAAVALANKEPENED